MSSSYRAEVRGEEAIASQTVLFASSLSCAAGTIHLVAAASHFSEYWLFGTFFVLVALAQFAWSAAVYRSPDSTVLQLGIWLSLTVAGVWTVSRTTGLPLGPGRWSPEAIGAQDASATLDELAIAALAWSLLRHRFRWTATRGGQAAVLGLLIATGLAAMSAPHAH
jgi:hypothetical protein